MYAQHNKPCTVARDIEPSAQLCTLAKTNDEIELLMTEFNTFIDTFITDTWDDSAVVEAKKFLDSGVYFFIF